MLRDEFYMIVEGRRGSYHIAQLYISDTWLSMGKYDVGRGTCQSSEVAAYIIFAHA